MSVKTHKGLRKRLHRTASGKVMYLSSGRRHLMSKKPAKRARRLRGWKPIDKGLLESLERQYGRV